ncbi:sensor histidine kinase [Labrys monachus]|uniref:histidine kinase n=1 Tax=Labrys monachus TaxID=217067 RepID=A0ABU0F6Z4_9HYPH|nr:sensor histidine kinase [Labrys monachus]MDQ0390336.1 signal transduction histidine kinase [Labrys monachus]
MSWGRYVMVLLHLVAMTLCLLAGSAQAGGEALRIPPPVTIPPGFSGMLSLQGHMEVLIDPSRALHLSDVLGEQATRQFQPLAGQELNLGYTRRAAWVRFAIRGSVGLQTALLSLKPNFVDIMDVYVGPYRPGVAAADFALFAMGDHKPLADAISGLDNVVALEPAPGETKLVYIRVATINSSLNLSSSLYSTDSHTLKSTLEALAYGFWFGGMAVLVTIQLVFYHFDRRASYLLLALSSVGAMLVYFGNLGLSRMLLFPEGGRYNDLFTGCSGWFGLFSGALMIASILETRRRAPVMYWIFMGAAATGLLGVPFVLLNRQLVFAPYGGIVIILAATLAMVQAIRSANEEGVGTRLHAAAFSILWLGLAITLSQRYSIASMPNWTAHSYAVSVLVQTLLLTGALAVRLRAAEAMNRIMSKQALIAAQAAEQRANVMVVEKTRQLAAAKKVAEEALRAELEAQQQQVRFMEVISHQYRTPLAAIRSNIDSVGLSLPAHDGANRSRLDRVRRAIARLVEILEINLTRSRLQGPSFQPALVRTSLRQIAAAAAARGRDLLRGPEIVLVIAPEAEGASVMADAEMLGIAIINLLENAAKFSALAGASPVVLSCSVEEGAVTIAVSDEGIGIPAGEIEGVLARSVRGSNAQSVEGSGMGLSLVSRIATAHGGKVVIDSVAGKGTTVRIILPILPAPSEEDRGILQRS